MYKARKGAKGGRGLDDAEAGMDERRLAQTPALKEYGKIEQILKADRFDTVKTPQLSEKAAAVVSEQSVKTADIGNQ